jgi:hypothetical protein
LLAPFGVAAAATNSATNLSFPSRTISSADPFCAVGSVFSTIPRAAGTELPPTAETLAMLLQVVENLDRCVSVKDLVLIHHEDQFLGVGLGMLEQETNLVAGTAAGEFRTGLANFATLVSSLHMAADTANQAGAEVILPQVKRCFDQLKGFFLEKDLSAAQALADRRGCSVHSDVTGRRGEACPRCGVIFDQPVRLIPTAAGLRLPNPQGVIASIRTVSSLVAGQEAAATLRLFRVNGSPLLPSDLIKAHTEKIHLFLLDTSLTDYHHVHPRPGRTPGEYEFQFTPQKSGNYHAWAEVSVYPYGFRQYAMTDIPGTGPGEVLNDRESRTTCEQNGLRYELQLGPAALKAGIASRARLRVARLDGTPFAELEPLMEAYAHLVGFGENLKTILHIHPQMPPVTDANGRGGPELEFQVLPTESGYVRFFAQVKIGGATRMIPFGLNVAP